MRATAEGTGRYASRFPAHAADAFYRMVGGLSVSSVGIGAGPGAADDATDLAETRAVLTATESGINWIDTAIHFRGQRSERAIGAALKELQRDEFVVCTKAGYLTPDAVPSFLKAEQVAGNMHSMDPAFLVDQIDRSRTNLGVDTLDVFYLQDPETQIGFVSPEAFDERIRRAFGRLEEVAGLGRIGCYGIATAVGFRSQSAVNLSRLAEIAGAEGGSEHHFRVVQLPFHLGMVEAFVERPESVLAAAARLGIAVVAGAAQEQAFDPMPESLAVRLPGLASDAQRRLQFTRSTPGISVALAGVCRPEQVIETLGVAGVPPLTPIQYQRLYQ
jgi:aryl-alcohol dehydrogenase-like predicted oxidoreductase